MNCTAPRTVDGGKEYVGMLHGHEFWFFLSGYYLLIT